jgi:membrane-bound lytic murein transglycosylase C
MKHLIFLSLFSTLLLSETFDNYLQKHNQLFNNYQNDLNKSFSEYKNAYDKSLQEYKGEIKKHWPKVEYTTSHVWVEYSSDYKEKQVIDYEKEQLRFEVYAQHEKAALVKIQNLYKKLLPYSVIDANKNDIVQNKTDNKLNIVNDPLQNDMKLLSSLITKDEQNKIKDKLSQKKLVQLQYNDNNIFIAKVDLPKNTIVKYATKYEEIIKKEHKRHDLSEELIYAIIHAESSFNPLAKSHIPAYGLMQIVPKSAGVDAYYHLYGIKKILGARYLYNPTNNIELGSTYLKILYYDYLKDIKDPMNRLQCTIAAYNTGVGNVARAFTNSKNIKQASKLINNLNSSEVYKRLMRKLPYKETRKYLYKVNKYLRIYKNYLSEKS